MWDRNEGKRQNAAMASGEPLIRGTGRGRAQQSEDVVAVSQAGVTWDNTGSHTRIPHHLQVPLPHRSACPSVSRPVRLHRQDVLIFAFFSIGRSRCSPALPTALLCFRSDWLRRKVYPNLLSLSCHQMAACNWHSHPFLAGLRLSLRAPGLCLTGPSCG